MIGLWIDRNTASQRPVKLRHCSEGPDGRSCIGVKIGDSIGPVGDARVQSAVGMVGQTASGVARKRAARHLRMVGGAVLGYGLLQIKAVQRRPVALANVRVHIAVGCERHIAEEQIHT
ncbi:MAG: hypothetical protein ACHQZS_01345 [Candidatus Binatales bacterium]